MKEDRNRAARELDAHTNLGKAFQYQDRQMGVKVSAVLQLWFEQTYIPLEARLAALENVWYRRWPRWVRTRVALMWAYVRAFFATDEIALEDQSEVPESGDVPPPQEADVPAGA